jgi:glycine hydroxymethyltransferase
MSLNSSDDLVLQIIQKELQRQQNTIELIASENFVSKAILEAQGSVLTNKYAEGYPRKRYYEGCSFVDEIEELAIERGRKLFNASYINVQPHSGSQANQAAFLALLKPGDTILSMSLDCGGHLTHGAAPNLSGKWFNIVHYTLNPETYLIDYDQIESLALQHKPQMIIAGFSAYSRSLDFAKFREIADKVGAYLLADVAHISGLIATDVHQSPLPFADIITSTTHKTLRGPRGGMIMSNNPDIAKKFDSAIFPGLQGGPLMHVIAAKAVGFGENLKPEFKNYIQQVIQNSRALAAGLIARGYDVITGGSDNHMLLVDLRAHKMNGKDTSSILEQIGISCNKNSIPFDPTSPRITSGIRLGTPACTTKGFKEKEFMVVANIIADVLDSLKHDTYEKLKNDMVRQVLDLAKSFPLYQ